MTEKPLDDVWATRDFPVLVEVTRRIDAGENSPSVDAIAEALEMNVDDVVRAGSALKRRGLAKGIGTDQTPILRFTDVTSEAYFLTGLHPSGDDALSSLVSALQQAADQVDDPDEKTRLRRLADGFLGLPRSVAGGVLTAVINQQLGV